MARVHGVENNSLELPLVPVLGPETVYPIGWSLVAEGITTWLPDVASCKGDFTQKISTSL